MSDIGYEEIFKGRMEKNPSFFRTSLFHGFPQIRYEYFIPQKTVVSIYSYFLMEHIDFILIGLVETSVTLVNNFLKNLIKLFVGKPLVVVFGDIDFSDGFSEYIFKNNVIKAVPKAFFRVLGECRELRGRLLSIQEL